MPPKRNRAAQRQPSSQNSRKKQRRHIGPPAYEEAKPSALSSEDITAKLQNSLGLFGKLPLEIRERIYENLHEGTSISVDASNPNLRYRTSLISVDRSWPYGAELPERPHKVTGSILSQVSQAMRNESLAVHYREHWWNFYLRFGSRKFFTWATTIGDRSLPIRLLTFYFEGELKGPPTFHPALRVDMDLLETKERVKIYGRPQDGELKMLRHETVKRSTALIKSIFDELATEWAEERRNGELKGSHLAQGVRRFFNAFPGFRHVKRVKNKFQPGYRYLY